MMLQLEGSLSRGMFGSARINIPNTAVVMPKYSKHRKNETNIYPRMKKKKENGTVYHSQAIRVRRFKMGMVYHDHGRCVI
jgi:hypothetical protein